MHTEHIEYLIPEYLDGTLADSLRPGVEEHLQHCGSCRTEFEQLRQTMEMLETQGTVSPPDGYFTTVLPRVRERLERKESRSIFANPLLFRLAIPMGLGALALFIVLSLPFPANEPEVAHNPLQAVMHGTTNDELVGVVLDMVTLQPLSSPTVEGETTALLGDRIFRGEHLLANADEAAYVGELTLDGSMPEELEQLNDADLDALVQRLGEGTPL